MLVAFIVRNWVLQKRPSLLIEVVNLNLNIKLYAHHMLHVVPKCRNHHNASLTESPAPHSGPRPLHSTPFPQHGRPQHSPAGSKQHILAHSKIHQPTRTPTTIRSPSFTHLSFFPPNVSTSSPSLQGLTGTICPSTNLCRFFLARSRPSCP